MKKTIWALILVVGGAAAGIAASNSADLRERFLRLNEDSTDTFMRHLREDAAKRREQLYDQPTISTEEYARRQSEQQARDWKYWRDEENARLLNKALRRAEDEAARLKFEEFERERARQLEEWRRR